MNAFQRILFAISCAVILSLAGNGCQSTVDDDPDNVPVKTVFTVFTADDGLADNTIVDCSVDYLRRGLWCATLNGVSFYSFDDSTFVTFGADTAIPKMETTSIVIDYMTGNVWVGTVSGAAYYDTEWHALAEMDSLVHRYVTSIAATGDGALWFGTKGGVSKWDYFGGWTSFRSTNGLADDLVTSVAVDAVNSVWVATTNGISVLQGTSWKTYGSSVLPNLYATAVYKAYDGTMWCGTVTGLARYDGSKWTKYGTLDGLPSPAVNDIAEDYSKTVWIATDNGPARFSGGKWVELTLPDPVTSDRVLSVAADRMTGDVWFGTANGLVRYVQQ